MTGILIAATAFAAGSALAELWNEVGNRLNKAVDAYNSSVATLETRVLVSARRLRDLKAAPEEVEIEVIEPVEQTARALQSPELLTASDASRQ